MAATKITVQEKRDFEKYTKFLVFKCIQIIVQSRLGERVTTQSRPFPLGSDWFNLAIKDIPEVLAECKKALTTGTLSVGQKICLEISLKTSEGESMILETWWLTLTDQVDPNIKISYGVYNRMSVLLKSLLCTSRAIPAYKLSRNQGPDSYVVCYRMYMTEPEMICLGEGYRTAKVGAVPSPLGTVVLSVAYRTKMLLSPQSSLERDLSLGLKDDHFNIDSSPRHSVDMPKPCYLVNRDMGYGVSAVEDGYVMNGELEYCATSFSTSPVDGRIFGQSPPDRPAILRKINTDAAIRRPSDFVRNRSSSDAAIMPPTFTEMEELGTKQVNGVHRSHEDDRQCNGHGDQGCNGYKNGKDTSPGTLQRIRPLVSSNDDEITSAEKVKNDFESYLEDNSLARMVYEMSKEDEANANVSEGKSNHLNNNHHQQTAVIQRTDHVDGNNLNRSPIKIVRNGRNHSQSPSRKASSVRERVYGVHKKVRDGEWDNSSESSHSSEPDEFVMIDVKNTLADLDDNTELGQFYRECRNPPELKMFKRPPVMGNIVSSPQDLSRSITEQLDQFEEQGKEFDDFMNSLSTGEIV